MIKVAINGYGRIGRIAHRVIVEKFKENINVVAINAGSSTDLKGWMFLLKYDTVYGSFPHDMSVVEASRNDDGLLGNLVIDGKSIPVYSQKDPALLPWKVLGVDIVIESTGHFLTKEKAQKHIESGAKAVVLSAPAKDETETFVLSVNSNEYGGQSIISCASCTTNSIAPVTKVIEKSYGIEKAMLTTIHGYTSDQRLHDGGHKDYRRARAATENIIPTSTGATAAAAKALPSLKDKFSGLALRVPVPVGSLSDLTYVLKKDVTVEEVNLRLTEVSKEEEYKGILAVTTDPIVSSDIIGSSYSSIIDLSLTQVVGGNMLKVISWYDNEYGYANRLVEEVAMVGAKITQP